MKQAMIINKLSFNFPFDSIVSGMIRKAKYMYKVHIQCHKKVDIAYIKYQDKPSYLSGHSNIPGQNRTLLKNHENQHKWRPKLNTACK